MLPEVIQLEKLRPQIEKIEGDQAGGKQLEF
jgi:hypothetical protein